MRYHPAHAASRTRTSPVLRAPRPLRMALSLLAAAAIGLVPATFVATAAHASAGDITIDSDLEQNESDAFTFEVRRDGSGLGALTADYATVDGGLGTAATTDDDYTPISGQTTFPAGRNVLKRFTVNGVADALDEDDETFTLKFMNPADHTQVYAFAYGTLDDDDATPTYSVSTVANPVTESGGNAQIKFTLSAPSGRTVTIPYATSNGTAQSGQDYGAASGTLSFSPGDTEKTVNVGVVDDSFDEPDEETFTMAGSSGTNVVTGSPSSVTVRIGDNDALPELSVTDPGNAAEGSPVPFTVTLTPASRRTVTVQVATANGTAVAGSDYTTVNQTVTFNPGDTTKTVNVPTATDSLDEVSPETLTLTLSAPSLATLSADHTSATGSIDDGDQPPNASLTPQTITEGNGTHDETFDVTLDAASGREVRVGYQVQDGTATAGSDFTAVPDGTLVFNPGDTTKQITVPIRGDVTDEANENFTIVLSNSGSTVGSGTGAVTITLNDDDNKPQLQTLPSVTQNEGATSGTATFTVGLTNPSDQAISLQVDTANGSAASAGSGPGSSDYDAVSSVVTLQPGETSKTIPIQVNGDAVYEGNETVALTVDLASGETDAVGPALNSTLTLTNDDAVPTAVLSSATQAEGTTVPISATVTGEAQAAIPITVAAVGASNTSNSIAADNADFDATNLTTSTSITPGATSVSLGSIAFAADQIDEPDQTVRVALTGAPLAAAQDFQTITDDPLDKLPTASIADTAATEGSSPVSVPVTLDFGATPNNDATSTERTIVVHYATADGSAHASDDYTADAATLTFAPGDMTHNVDVAIADDAVYERSETFTVALSSPSPAGLPIGTGTATVTLADNDNNARPTFTLSGPASVGETAGTVNYTVELNHANTEAVDFTVSSSDGTAKKNAGGPGNNDYAVGVTTVTIPANQTQATIPVTIVDDEVYEPSENATVTVALAQNENDATGSPQNAGLTIVDNDPVPTVTLSAGTAAEGGSVPVTATVTGVAQNAIPITLTASGAANGNSDPAEGGDFDATPLTASSIPAGDQTGAPVPLGHVDLANDQVDEPAETVRIALTSGVVASAQAYATITDDPNDQAPAAYVDDLGVSEGATAHVAVRLAFGQNQDATSSERTFEVAYTTQNDTARSPGDYAAGSGTLTFGPSVTSQQVDVPVVDDPAYERAETFKVVLTSVSPDTGTDPATIGDGTGVVTIAASDTGAKPTFSVADESVGENVAGGAATFTVTLSDAGTEDVSFDVSMTNGTAVDGGSNPGANDYDAPTGTLVIHAGDTHGTISVPVNDDGVYEADEDATLVVALAGGEDDAAGGPDQSTLTITNDDAAPSIALNSGAAATENGNVDVVATVTGVAQADTTFTLTLSGDGADPAEGSDYVDTHVDGVIPGGTASGSQVTLRTIHLAADHVDEADEVLRVVVADAAGHVTTRTATYTIHDDANDLPPAASVGDASVTEADGAATVHVTLAFGNGNDATSTEQTVSVGYATANGTATAGSDYTAAANAATLSFAPGDTDKTISVPIADDAIFERAETFSVRLTSITPDGATIADDTGAVTIAESDVNAKPTWSLSADPQVRENVAGGAAQYTVTLSDTSSVNVTFDVGVTNGTAVDSGSTPGADDFDQPASTVTIPAGQTTGTISVPIHNDAVYEADETATVSVALTQGEDGATGGPVNRSLTIINDDTVPSIALNTGVTQAEGTSVNVVATLTGQAQAALTFDLTVAGDNGAGRDPAENADYTANTARGTIAAGAATGSETTLATIQLNNDTVDEAVESLRVTATDIDATVAAAAATYNISDDANDLPPSISIGDVTVAENVNNASVPVSLSFGGGNGATSTERDTVVTYATADGTATAGADYTGTAGDTLTILAGSTTGNILLPITDDSTYEVAETFTVHTTAHTPSEAVVSRGTGTVTISRNDTSSQSSFTVANVSRPENGGPATFTIALTAPTTQPVSFTASMTPGTAVTGGSGVGSNDYTFTAPGSLVIPAGSTTVTVPVTLNGDTVYEADETATLTVALAAGEDDATGGPVNATLTITNDDGPPRITLNSGDSGTEGTDIAVVATSDTAVQSAVTLDLTFSGDSGSGNTAAAAADYVDSGAQATIPAGTAAGTPVTLRTFRLSNDHVDEPVEAVRVVARATDMAIDAAAGVYRINDDPNDLPPAVSIGDVTVDEGVGNAEVPVTLSFDNGTNDATSTTRSVTVTASTIGGTATLGSDVQQLANASLTIAGGDLSGAILVPVVDDQRNEEDETFTVKATAVSPPEGGIADDTGTVTITDNDQNVARPTFAVADRVTKTENAAGTADLSVTLSGPAEDDVTFTVGIADGTAVDAGTGTGSNDYNPPASTLTIPRGQTTGTVSVPVTRDSVYEEDETATVTVGLATGERDATGDPQDATLVIENDDAKPTMTLNTASGYEGDEVGVVALISGTAQDDVDYDVTFYGEDGANANAAEVDDFDASGIDGTIPAGTASGTRLNLGSLALADDTIDEPTETIRAAVHDPSTDDTTNDRTSTYRIFDDPTDVPPSVSIGDLTVGEGDGTADVPVTLAFTGDTTATEQDVTAAYTTVNGTARSGLDYTAGTGTVRIAAGDTEGVISVPITDDTLFENDQTFTVRLSSATPTGVVVDNATGTVTIAENDEPATPTLTAPAVLDAPGYVTMTGTAGEGAQVQLYVAQGSSGGSFTAGTTVTADSSGAFSIRRNFDVGYRVQVRANGLTSATQTVLMRQSPTLTGGSTARGTATLTVTANPRAAGLVAQIQRANANGTWTTVSTGTVNSAGSYSGTVRGLTPGASYTFRGVILANAAKGTLIGASAARRIAASLRR